MRTIYRIASFILVFGISYTYAQVDTLVPLTGEVREKYIQRALQMRANEEYLAAVQQLDSILLFDPADAGALLFKGDLLLQGKKFPLAAATYKQLLPLKFEPTITQINLSYALFLSHKPAKALKFAESAWKQDPTNTNAIINYFNAMLWNIKTDEAEQFLKANDRLLNDAQKLVMQARLYTTSGNYEKGLESYSRLVKNYEDKYFVQEYAEVLIGKKDLKEAEVIIKKDSSMFTPKEYNALMDKLKATQVQRVGTESVYFADIAKNVRIENGAYWQQKEGNVYRMKVGAGFHSVESNNIERTTSIYLNGTCNERWSKALSGESSLQLQRISPLLNKSFMALTGKQSIQYQPNDRRMVGGMLSSEILNFTANLYEQNIRMTNLGYVTHLMFNGKNGFYSQGSAGALSDKNQRYLFFGSVYHLFRTEPTLKGGINFSALHYSDDALKGYFSPNRYLSSEVFADYSTALPQLSKYYLQLQAAVGMQKIEKNDWEPAFRLQSEVGFRLKRFDASLKYQTSNVASVAGTGYKFNWFTFKMTWMW